MKITSVGIWWNPQKQAVRRVANDLVNALERCGLRPVLDTELAAALGRPEYLCQREVIMECDMLAVLGGDGTLLGAVCEAAPRGLPLLGVNMGNIGFLSELEPEGIDHAISRIKEGRALIDQRMMLEAVCPGARRLYALNEVVFHRGDGGLRALTLEVMLGGELIDRLAADGLVISSPTGSTGYSLSAGGPIVAPGIDCILITPLAPHTLRERPIVLPPTAELKVRVMGDAKYMAVTADSAHSHRVSAGEWVSVTRAPIEARFVRLAEQSFFDVLKLKLWDWSR